MAVVNMLWCSLIWLFIGSRLLVVNISYTSTKTHHKNVNNITSSHVTLRAVSWWILLKFATFMSERW